MSQTIRSHDESSLPSIPFSAGDATPVTRTESGKIFRLEASAKAIPVEGQTIDALIGEWSADPQFAQEMSRARQRRSRVLAPTEELSLKSLRLSRGLSQADLAHAIGMKQPHIARMERGHMCPSLPTLRRLAAALQVDMNTIDKHLPQMADGVEPSL